ncbi:hypothetical protein KQX54_015332 [Cotesia glomerata]|uniref:Uncharacterized protein n=1 Tax=Cotesia glomerata TaxID=32391 RepID=A0AAV7IQG4_COTGL|nr:hypothetical protein KQX54_015332 [Cotesia glomerata]
MPVRNNLGKLERYLGNSNQDKNEDIYSKANSMISFMSTISNTLSHFRRNLKNTYRIYTDNVQGEDKKLIVPYESYVAAVNKYKRIKQLLDEFWRAFSLDYLDVEWLISKVSEVRQQHTNLMNQYNRIVDSSSKASQQLVGDLISTDKKHDKLSSQLEKRLLNFSALKRSLKDNKIVYQSFRGKKFYISISSDVDDLLRIFGFDKFSRDRKAKNVEETSSKPSRSSKSSTSSASKPSTPSKPSTTSKQTPGEQKSEDIFKLPSFIVSITASELKNAGISLPNIESIDDFITFAKNRWLTWSDIDLMSKEKNFDEFIKNESYLLPIARNFGKLDLLKQNYREMIELENLLIKSKPESENSLDKILNLDESYLSEQQLKFLNLKIGITEIGYHFMNFSIDSMVRKLILKYKEESQESISSMISSIDIKRMQIVAFKLMIFMQNKLAEKLNERLGLMKLRLGIKDSDEDKYIKSTLEDIKSAIRDIVEENY